MYLQAMLQSSLKLKRLRPFLFRPQLKICMCSSSCSNIVYSKVTSSGSHRSLSAPACCRTASPRRQRASCTTPTGTGSTGHSRWPTPDSARPQHPGTARGKYTPDPPTSGASTPTRARPPLRSRMRPCRLDAPVMRSDVALRRGEASNDDPRQCFWIRIRDQCFEDCGAAALALLWTRLHCISDKSLLYLQGPSAYTPCSQTQSERFVYEQKWNGPSCYRVNNSPTNWTEFWWDS